MDTKIIVHTPYHLLASLGWVESLENSGEITIYLYYNFDWKSIIDIDRIKQEYDINLVLQFEPILKSKLYFFLMICFGRRYKGSKYFRLMGFNDRTFLFTYFNTTKVLEKLIFYEGARVKERYKFTRLRQTLNKLSRSHVFLPDGRDSAVVKFIASTKPDDKLLSAKWFRFNFRDHVSPEKLGKCFKLKSPIISNADFVLFLQPLIEDGLLSEVDYVQWIIDTIDSYDKSKTFVIKTHPRQTNMEWINRLLPTLRAERKIFFFNSKVPWEVYEIVYKIAVKNKISYSSSLTR